MSTDYGLRCLDCQEDNVHENMHTYGAEDMLKYSAELAELSIAFEKVCNIADITSWECDNFREFIEWLAKHKGHKLIIVDEYGKEYPKT